MILNLFVEQNYAANYSLTLTLGKKKFIPIFFGKCVEFVVEIYSLVLFDRIIEFNSPKNDTITKLLLAVHCFFSNMV